MDRKEKGKRNGEGFFKSDPIANVEVIVNAVKELRTIIRYLKKRGVKSISAWGGSIGATIVLLTDQTVEFDHISMMIPVLNMETVTLKNKHMKKVIQRYKNSGFDKKTLCDIYCLISPSSYSLKTNPDRVYIMLAKYDQLSPYKTILDYAKKNKIKHISSYKRSHSTILLTDIMYENYARFLMHLNN